MPPILIAQKISTPPYLPDTALLTHTIFIANTGDSPSQGLTLVEQLPEGTDYLDGSATFAIDGAPIAGTEKRQGLLLETTPALQLLPNKTLTITYQTQPRDGFLSPPPTNAALIPAALKSQHCFEGGYEEKVKIPTLGLLPIKPWAQKGDAIRPCYEESPSRRPIPKDYAQPLLLAPGTYQVSYRVLPLSGQSLEATVAIAVNEKVLKTTATSIQHHVSEKVPLEHAFPLMVASGECCLSLVNLGGATFFKEISLKVVKLD